VGGAIIIASSFGTQFVPAGIEMDAVGNGCSAWTRCAGDPIGLPLPDMTATPSWLAVLGAAVAIVAPAMQMVSARLRSACAARFQLLAAWCVVLAIVGVLVFASCQPRFVGYNERNHEFEVRPGWGIVAMLLGAAVVLVAAEAARGAAEAAHWDLASIVRKDGGPSRTEQPARLAQVKGTADVNTEAGSTTPGPSGRG
jgi:hypothetical protein